MRYFKLIFLTAFFLYFIMPSYSEPVYIWKKDDGTTVYSFFPPPENITPKRYLWGSAYPNSDGHSKTKITKFKVTSRVKEIATKRYPSDYSMQKYIYEKELAAKSNINKQRINSNIEKTPSGQTIYTGPRGGRYVITRSGKKRYLRK